MKIVFSDKCLAFHQEGHPESPQRVASSHEFLKGKFEFVPPGEIEESDIAAVHSQELIEQVRSGGFFDADSPSYQNIFSYAFLSAAAAVTAAEIALGGENAFSLMRPPGHHAGKNSLGGFCYFNNVAVATAAALTKVGRVAIIDFDCHHGNGTQDIFLGSENVLYASLHRSPLYPGTGLVSEANCLNYPLAGGTDEATYMQVFEKALGEVSRFVPDAIAVSAGFDTFKGDPLAGLGLELSTYETIGRSISQLAKPVFAVLEGGYARELKECIGCFLEGLSR